MSDVKDFMSPVRPTWCPGCGNHGIWNALKMALAELDLAPHQVMIVSGIGCAGRLPVYVDFNTLHTTHGRALTFATGIKLAKPKLQVIVIMGDGDAMAIGGNHFIHAARRNINLTAIIVNNSTYGMTGGQYSPTTPYGALATTALISIPTSKPKNTPANALSFLFGVRTSSKKKKTAKPTPLITTVHQLAEFSVLVSSTEDAFTTSTETTMMMKMPRNSQSNMVMTFQ